MHLINAVCLLALAMTMSAEAQTKTPFTLKRGGSTEPKKCTTDDKKPGICVDKSNCNDAHEIEHGGRIIDSELRASKDCNTFMNEWCCTEKEIKNSATSPPPEVSTSITRVDVTPPIPVVPPSPPAKAKKCFASASADRPSDFPWFVKLYRQGLDKAYCLGVMLASRVILTAATCVIQAEDEFMWARIPNSANPEANFTILSKTSHPNYVSGSRLNDIALLNTLSEVRWNNGEPRAACLNPEKFTGGSCTAVNVDYMDNLESVQLYATPGACTRAGNVSDAICGTALHLGDLLTGAPIVCPKNNWNVLSGLTKTATANNKEALLGSLDYSWLTKSLKEVSGLTESDYLLKLNY